MDKICNICQNNEFIGISNNPNRQYAICSNCNSLERHRAFINYCTSVDRNINFINKKTLIFTPNNGICYFFKENNYNLTTANIIEGFDIILDISNMNIIEDNTYDFIILSHILYNVKYDISALCELKRIIKKDGQLFVMDSITDVRDYSISIDSNHATIGYRLYSTNSLYNILNNYFKPEIVNITDPVTYTSDTLFHYGFPSD